MYGLVAADLKRLWTCSPRLAAAGDWSYTLYLIHTLVIAGVCMVWRPPSRPGLIDNALTYAGCLGLSLTLSALFWAGLERPTTRLVARLLRAQISIRRPAAPGLADGGGAASARNMPTLI
jgi:peptidoglycan/LPS O-acetylase OafA/YrhL